MYGENVASYAVALELRTRANLPELYLSGRSLSQEGELNSFESVQSSGTLGEVYAVLLDVDGQVVTSSQKDSLTLTLTTNSQTYPAKYDAGSSLWSQFGVFNLTSVTFVGEPGTTAWLYLSSALIDVPLEQTDSYYSYLV